MQPNYHLLRESIIGSGDDAQDLTTSWVDLGGEHMMFGYSNLGVWLTLDINDSQNARIRALAKLDAASTGDSSGAEFLLPIETVGASAINVEDEYYEFTDDANGNYILNIKTDAVIPFVQLQVQVGSTSEQGTAGQIDYCQITKRQ